ncbi:MAG: ABC transporter permease [Chloroflexi bacterium]|nr:ABC transporter permease [Chloroflexota bacterium]
MSEYLLRRFLLIFPLLIGITFLDFVFINLAPGDPINAMIDPMEMTFMSKEEIQARRAELGLDKPLLVRYASWVKELARGNLGYSIMFKNSVAKLIRDTVGNTITLMAWALVTSIIVGIVLGIISALRPYTKLDYALTAFAFTGVAMPGFFFGLALIYLISLRAGLLPTSGLVTPGAPSSVLDSAQHLFLPVAALAYEGIASIMRYTRGSMLEVLHQEYITTARAKGLREPHVILRHGLVNAMLPVITIIGLRLPALFGGSVIIESIFSLPGMGKLMVDATNFRDYPLIMGGLLISALLVLLSNLLADISYAVADPRIRYQT